MNTLSHEPPAYHVDKRLDAVLKAITPTREGWPTQEADWEAARRLQEEGVDLAMTQGTGLKVTLFHRLTKQLFKAKASTGLTTQELLAPFRHLSHLTNRRALHSDHNQAWSQLNQSFSMMAERGERDFHTAILELFIEHAQGPFSNTGNFAGMMHRASCLDLPEQMAWLSSNSPEPLDMWRDVDAGGPRVLVQLLATEDLHAKRPQWPYSSSLHQRLTETQLPIGKLYTQWLVAEDRNAFLDAQLPQAKDDPSPAVSRRPRF